MILEVVEKGSFISKVGDRIRVRRKQEVLAEISITKVDGLIIGRGVSFSSNFLELCAKNNVPLFFNFGPSTYFLPSSFLSKPSIRIAQIKLSLKNRKKFIYEIIYNKLKNQKTVANKLGISLDFDLKPDYSLPYNDFVERIRNKEALFAREYWKIFSDRFRGFKRIKLFAEDKLNRTINYSYGILRYSVEKAVLSAGLDPYIGFLHSVREYRESFIFDVMEPLRPYIDYFVYNYLDKQKEEDFSLFKKDFAKYLILKLRERRFKILGHIYDFKLALVAQMKEYADFFLFGKPFEILEMVEWSL